MIKEFEIIEIRVEEGVDLGYGIKDYMLLNLVLYGGNSFIVWCYMIGTHQILHGSFANENQF